MRVSRKGSLRRRWRECNKERIGWRISWKIRPAPGPARSVSSAIYVSTSGRGSKHSFFGSSLFSVGKKTGARGDAEARRILLQWPFSKAYHRRVNGVQEENLPSGCNGAWNTKPLRPRIANSESFRALRPFFRLCVSASPREISRLVAAQPPYVSAGETPTENSEEPINRLLAVFDGSGC